MGQKDKFAKAIYVLLEAQKKPICDQCISKNAKVPNSSQVADMSAALGATPLFYRERVICCICQQKKETTEFKSA